MVSFLKKFVKTCFNSCGLYFVSKDVYEWSKENKGVKVSKLNFFSDDKFSDLVKGKNLTIFDVGANIGDKSKLFSDMFQGATIHCFEPDPVNLKGGQGMIQAGNIGALVVELIIGDFFEKPACLYRIQSLLCPYGYKLYTIYSLGFEKNGQLRGFDAVFLKNKVA